MNALLPVAQPPRGTLRADHPALRQLLTRRVSLVPSERFQPSSQVSHQRLLEKAEAVESMIGELSPSQRLDAAREAQSFRLLNWLKDRFVTLREQLRRSPRIDAELAGQLRSLWDASQRVRNCLVECYLRLALAAARAAPGSAAWSNDELTSEIAQTMLDAVEHFDADRGFRFSTYLTLAVRRRMSRLRQQAGRQRAREGVSLDEQRVEAPPQRSESAERRRLQAAEQLVRLMDTLESRERVILRARLGLDVSRARPSLRRLGEQLGISRERVRQLEQRALRRLQRLADQHQVTAPWSDLPQA